MDADYELPIAFNPTRANVSDTAMLSPMMESLEENHPEIAYAAEDLSADRGYGSEENNRKLFDGYGVKPIIVIRHM